jgi:hypothetical protein
VSLARWSHKFFPVLCIPIQLGASRNASFEFSNLAFVWKGNYATNADVIFHDTVTCNSSAAMSDFIQFVRITVPVSSWISALLTGVRGQAQRLLPLVVSNRRHLCAVCGQLPSALPMVLMRTQFSLSLYTSLLFFTSTKQLNIPFAVFPLRPRILLQLCCSSIKALFTVCILLKP